MSLDHRHCFECGGYVIEGTLRRTAMTLSSRCRCLDTEQDKRVEAELRERRTGPFTECVGDPLKNLEPKRRAA